MTVGSRSIRMMAILFVFNSILAAVALFNMYSVAEQVRTTAEIQYSQFLDLYTFVSSIEFIMLLFIMPALTASSISGERERQTLELMLTTTMEPRDMVLGKLASSLVTMLVLAVSALPVQALVFVYGGVTLQDIGMLFLCHGVVAILTGSIGIFYSSVLRRSTVSTVCSYVTVVALTAERWRSICLHTGWRSGRQIRMHLISMHRKWQVPAFYAISFFSIRLSRFIM